MSNSAAYFYIQVPIYDDVQKWKLVMIDGDRINVNYKPYKPPFPFPVEWCSKLTT